MSNFIIVLIHINRYDVNLKFMIFISTSTRCELYKHMMLTAPYFLECRIKKFCLDKEINIINIVKMQQSIIFQIVSVINRNREGFHFNSFVHQELVSRT